MYNQFNVVITVTYCTPSNRSLRDSHFNAAMIFFRGPKGRPMDCRSLSRRCPSASMSISSSANVPAYLPSPMPLRNSPTDPDAAVAHEVAAHTPASAASPADLADDPGPFAADLADDPGPQIAAPAAATSSSASRAESAPAPRPIAVESRAQVFAARGIEEVVRPLVT